MQRRSFSIGSPLPPQRIWSGGWAGGRSFSRLSARSGRRARGPAGELVAIDDLWLFLHLVFEKMIEYRCLYRDVDYVATEFPRLAPRLPRINARGLVVLERLCGQLASAGALRAGSDDIKVLSMQMLLVATCWHTFARMLPPSADTGPGRAAYQVLSLLTPYLTDDGRQYVDYLRRKYVA
jgi:hypothetical protein